MVRPHEARGGRIPTARAVRLRTRSDPDNAGRAAEGIYKDIADAIEELLIPPQAATGEPSVYPAEKAIAEYLGEPNRPTWKSHLVYRVPWALLKAASAPFRSQEHDGSHESCATTPEVPLPVLGGLSALFDRNYRYGHRQAVVYAILYRGSFLWNYILGASAVTCALLSYADEAPRLSLVGLRTGGPRIPDLRLLDTRARGAGKSDRSNTGSSRSTFVRCDSCICSD